MNDAVATAPLALPVIMPGSHGHVAEKFRHEAIQARSRLSFCVAMMDWSLRMRPDENDMMAEWSRAADSASVEMFAATAKFWQTREVVGEG